MKQWFRKRGLDIGKTQLVSMLVEDMPVAVAQGLVDAVVTWEPYGSQIVRELGANAQIMSRGEAGLLSDNVGIVGAEDYVKKNPDIVERFATGIAMAAKFVRESPAETAEIATRYLDGLKVVDAVEAYKHLSWDPRVSVCVVEGSIRSGNGLARSGQIKMDRPFVAADFYDLTAYKAVTAKHPELFAGLPPLPDKIEDCKGQLD
jgi:ABC-type nitrate/sulfonate/bicarbonate transport system substrate-binding protein